MNWKKDFKVARFSDFFISFFLIFKFFCSPSLPRVSGSRKDVKHGSKVKGNTKTELMMMRMMMRMGAAGTPHPPTTHSLSSIKVNITVPLHTWTFKASLSHSSREGRHLCMSFYFIFLSLVSAGWEALTLTLTPACLPANLCDSLANECLPAAESSALQQPSSPLHYPTADPDRLAPPLPPLSQAESSLQKLAPPPSAPPLY